MPEAIGEGAARAGRGRAVRVGASGLSELGGERRVYNGIGSEVPALVAKGAEELPAHAAAIRRRFVAPVHGEFAVDVADNWLPAEDLHPAIPVLVGREALVEPDRMAGEELSWRAFGPGAHP